MAVKKNSVDEDIEHARVRQRERDDIDHQTRKCLQEYVLYVVKYGMPIFAGLALMSYLKINSLDTIYDDICHMFAQFMIIIISIVIDRYIFRK